MSQLNPNIPAFEPNNAYPKPKQSESVIKNVWNYNLKEEILKISHLLESYPYVAMDTEFPGIIMRLAQHDMRQWAYIEIKENVNILKLIQVGITLSDENGNKPSGVCTWQFNMRFDLDNDVHSEDSIRLLKNSGINFDTLKRDGIDPYEFSEYFQISGLVLNDDVTYVAFHSGYDLAYLLKAVTCQPLPDSQEEFTALLKKYVPNYYDLKYILGGFEKYRGGLNRVAELTHVARVGKMHQAGSDSLVTIDTFFKIKEELYSTRDIEGLKNLICGLDRPQGLAQ